MSYQEELREVMNRHPEIKKIRVEVSEVVIDRYSGAGASVGGFTVNTPHYGTTQPMQIGGSFVSPSGHTYNKRGEEESLISAKSENDLLLERAIAEATNVAATAVPKKGLDIKK